MIFPEFLKCIKDIQMETVEKYGNIFMVNIPLPGILPLANCTTRVNDPSVVKELAIRQMNQNHDPCNFTTRTDPFCKMCSRC